MPQWNGIWNKQIKNIRDHGSFTPPSPLPHHCCHCHHPHWPHQTCPPPPAAIPSASSLPLSSSSLSEGAMTPFLTLLGCFAFVGTGFNLGCGFGGSEGKFFPMFKLDRSAKVELGKVRHWRPFVASSIRKFWKSWFSQMMFMIPSQYYTDLTTAHNLLHVHCRIMMVLWITYNSTSVIWND